MLRHVNYRFEGGRIYAITGRSGAGKTTLLSLLSQLTKPTEGKILYNGLDVSEVDQYLYRSQYAGVIFQSFNLLMHLTAVENVMLSMDIAGVKKENNRAYAMELLEKVGLSKEESQRRILKLSGGQQQRVAIARAVSYDPSILLADELPEIWTRIRRMKSWKSLKVLRMRNRNVSSLSHIHPWLHPLRMKFMH